MKILFLLSFLLSHSAFCALSELGSAELARLKSGKLVKKVATIKDEVWPKVSVFILIPNTPKQNMDVFKDFESQKKYIPDMLESKIIQKINDNEYVVSFVMRMPWPVRDTSYTTRNIIEHTGDNYLVRWDLIKSNQMKATEGSVQFEVLGDKTLLSYTSHITPDSEFSGLFKGRVEGDVVKTVKIIAKYLDNTLKQKPGH